MVASPTGVRRLVTPSPTLTRHRDRSQAQLLIALLLTLIAAGTINLILPILESRDGYWFSESFCLRLLALVGGCAAYAISLTSRFRVGALLAIIMVDILTYAHTTPADLHENHERLAFLTLPVLFAILFFRVRIAVLVAAINVASMFLYGLRNNGLEFIQGQIGFVILSSALIIITWVHQRNIFRWQRAELAESNHRYRQLIDLNPDAVIVFDENRLLYTNQAAADLYRVPSPNDLIGKTYDQIWQPEHAARIYERAKYTMAHQETVHLAHDRSILPDGRKVTLEVSSAPIVYNQQAARLLIVRDITQRIENERRLLLIQQAIESTSDAISITDMQGKSIFWNQAFTYMLGKTILSNYKEIFKLFESPRQGMLIYRHMMQGNPWRGEVLLKNQNGKIIPALLRTNIIHDNDGKPIGVMAAATDISHQKQIEDTRLQLQLEQERIRLLEDFVRDVSHDFKTPLSVINMKIYLLEKELVEPKQQAHLQTLIEQVQRVQMLLDSMFLMLRVDRGDMATLVEVDVNRIMEAAERDCRAFFEDKPLTVEKQLDANLPILLANVSELHRVFSNLLENAFRYTPDGGSITLRTRHAPQTRTIICEVEDTGIGISPEDLQHIFERFYRADKARQMQTGGAGLGLAIARKIIERHGGKLEAESQVGKGSVFRVVFDLDYLTVSKQSLDVMDSLSK